MLLMKRMKMKMMKTATLMVLRMLMMRMKMMAAGGAVRICNRRAGTRGWGRAGRPCNEG